MNSIWSLTSRGERASRRSNLLGFVAATAILACGAQPCLADPNVDGMDHSKLNHGVLGAPAKNSSSSDHTSGDPDVTGMDHSKLNHGVLGAGGWRSPK